MKHLLLGWGLVAAVASGIAADTFRSSGQEMRKSIRVLGVYCKPTGFIYNARKLVVTLFALAPHVLQVNWERIVAGCLSGC